MAIQGHSRSPIWGSVESLRETACKNAGLISKVSEDTASETLKIAVVDNPTAAWRPLSREPHEYKPYIARN